MQQILLIVLPVFCIIFIGYALKRVGLLHEHFVADLHQLLYYVALPLLLFYKIGRAEFSENFMPLVLYGLLASMLCVFVFAYWYGKVRSYPPSVLGAFVQASGRGNLAYVGLAIVFSAYGEGGVAAAGILLGFIVPVINLLSVISILYPLRKEKGGKQHALLLELFGNPIFLGSFAGVVWSYFSFPLPQVAEKVLAILTPLSLPLALLVIGGAFSFGSFRGTFLRTLIATVLKLIILPALCLFFLLLLGVRGEGLGIGVLLAATPTAAVATIIAHQLGGDSVLSANVIMLSTLSSVFTYTAILYILQSFCQ